MKIIKVGLRGCGVPLKKKKVFNRLLKELLENGMFKKIKHTAIPTIGGKKCRNDGTFNRTLSVAILTI